MISDTEGTRDKEEPASVEQKKTASEPAMAPAAKGVETDASPVDTMSFAGYPQTKYHPVFGAKAAADPNEAQTLFMPAHDWFGTAEEADMHRTETEALQVMHHNQRVKLDQKIDFVEGRDPKPSTGPDAAKGVVRNSVAAQESLNAGDPEPL